VKEVEEEEELKQTQPKHPTLLNHNHHQPPLNTIQLTHSTSTNKTNKMKWDCEERDMEYGIVLRI
jgi:hypothetical protein